MTVRQIVEEVVADAGHAGDLEFEIQQTLPELPYTVQYRETDYNFISRLLEHDEVPQEVEQGHGVEHPED